MMQEYEDDLDENTGYDEYDEYDEEGLEEEYEEEVERQPTKEELEYLALRQRLKDSIRKKMKREDRNAQSSMEKKSKLPYNDFGSFFGPSRPVISSRVIQESKSLLENEQLASRILKPSVASKKPVAAGSSGSKNGLYNQRSKVVNEVQKKVEKLKDTRDYSFLFSDDADLPVSKKEPSLQRRPVPSSEARSAQSSVKHLSGINGRAAPSARDERRPASVNGQIHPRPGSSGSQMHSRPASSGGQTHSRPAPSSGQTHSRPASSGGQTHSRPASSGSQVHSRPGLSGNQMHSRPGPSGSQTQSRMSSGGQMQSRVSSGNQTQARMSSGNPTQSRMSSGNQTQSRTSSGSQLHPRPGSSINGQSHLRAGSATNGQIHQSGSRSSQPSSRLSSQKPVSARKPDSTTMDQRRQMGNNNGVGPGRPSGTAKPLPSKTHMSMPERRTSISGTKSSLQSAQRPPSSKPLQSDPRQRVEQRKVSHDPTRSQMIQKHSAPPAKHQLSKPLKQAPMVDDRRPKKKPKMSEDDIAFSMIRQMFRTDRFAGRDDDDSDMEANWDDIVREEKRSARIAKQEDEEQLRLIEEEERRERMRKKRKLSH